MKTITEKINDSITVEKSKLIDTIHSSYFIKDSDGSFLTNPTNLEVIDKYKPDFVVVTNPIDTCILSAISNRHNIPIFFTEKLVKSIGKDIEAIPNFFVLEKEQEFKNKFSIYDIPYAPFYYSHLLYLPQKKILLTNELFSEYLSHKSVQLFYGKDENFEEMVKYHKVVFPSSNFLKTAMEKVFPIDIDYILPLKGRVITREAKVPVFTALNNIVCANLLIKNNLEVLFQEKANIIEKQMIDSLLYSNADIKELFPTFQLIFKEIPSLNRIALVSQVGKEVYMWEFKRNTYNKLKSNLNYAYLLFKGYSYILPIFSCKNVKNYVMIDGNLTEVDKEYLDTIIYKTRSLINFIIKSKVYMDKKIETLRKLASKDFLTGMFTRRYLYEVKDVLSEKAYVVVFFDLDHFKKINDTYGHKVGDCVLQEFSKFIRKNIRSDDIAIRYGGEEFVVIFINTVKENIYTKVDRMRQEWEKYEPCGIKSTFTAGIADYREGGSMDDVIQLADYRLYRGKKQRNTVVCND